MKCNHHVLQSKGTIENQQTNKATNKLKHLGVTLTKHIKDLHEKNFRSLKKEIEEDFIKWKKKIFHAHGLAGLI